MTLCHWISFKQTISLKNCLTPKKVLFNLKNIILVLFNTEKYIKSHEFSQDIINEVKTALIEMIPRNIIQAHLSKI